MNTAKRTKSSTVTPQQLIATKIQLKIQFILQIRAVSKNLSETHFELNPSSDDFASYASNEMNSVRFCCIDTDKPS